MPVWNWPIRQGREGPQAAFISLITTCQLGFKR